MGQAPHVSVEQAQAQMLEWIFKSAEGGLALSMLKLGRAYLKRLPSSLSYDPAEAARWFRR